MQKITPPDEFFGPLLDAVHEAKLFKDGKAFSDLIANAPIEIIKSKYLKEKSAPDFDLKSFFETHFQPLKTPSSGFISDTSLSTEEHIGRLWKYLMRAPDKEEISTRIPLPKPYIVPGGRFAEIYYWDSYFTMLGLKEAGKFEIIESMIDNFCHLITLIGHVPNGTRSYFIGRSQPPYLSWMVNLLADSKGAAIYKKYRPFLLKEYDFWMKGNDDGLKMYEAAHRVVKLPEGTLNRYWDERSGPREEMYGDDVETAELSTREHTDIYKDLRAGAESGWDYTVRWFLDEKSITTIACSSIIPIDLNSLLYDLEMTLSKTAENPEEKALYKKAASNRHALILKYCWNNEKDFFFDYNFKLKKQTNILSMAGMQPLFSKMVNQEIAQKVMKVAANELLKPGGMVSTTNHSGQQWDAPNGWAPLQWVAFKAAKNYDNQLLAQSIAERWTSLNAKTFKSTGKMMEKYNVEDINLIAGGGEYPVQDGFGWTNGVYLALKAELKKS